MTAVTRRRRASSPTIRTKARGNTGDNKRTDAARQTSLLTALYQFLDLGGVLLRLFGGCCTNVWSYEELLRLNPQIGSALTFSQMVFIATQTLPHFLERVPGGGILPRIQSPRVPLARWATQVVVLTAGSLLNNWVYRYHIPLTVQIVFRSAGLAVSMLFGRLVRGKSYTKGQVFSVLVVSIGVLLSALSRPTGSSGASSPEDATEYTIGLVMLVASLMLTGLLGILQEQTYERYGPVWREGVFYTHALSLPIFLFLINDIKIGFNGLAAYSRSLVSSNPTNEDTGKWSNFAHLLPYAILFGNLVTQSICVSGVNQLTSRVSSVSTNLALTVRKALSLCLSVWWFGSGWNGPFAAGASLVFSGSLLYALVSRPPPKAKVA